MAFFPQQNNFSQNKPLFGSQPPNTFGAFGQNQQNTQNQQQQGQQQPQSTSLFGGQNQSTGNTGLFGSSTTQPSTALFGSSTSQSQPQQQQQSTGLFGQPASTGLFGSNSAGTSQSQPQPQQQQQPTGLFGQPASTFGGASGFGGFGASNTNQQQQNQQQQNQGQAQPGSSGGFSLFGQSAQSQQQQQQQQQQSTAGAPLFTRTTKFNDLPEEIRKKFEQIDAHIQGRVQIATELKQHKLGDEPQKGAEQIRSVHKDLVNSINKLRSDIASMRELRARMDQAMQDTIAATRIIDAFKASSSGSPNAPGGGAGAGGQGQSGGGGLLMLQNAQAQTVWLKNYAGFPLEFFTRVTEQLRERLQWFNTTLEQIERKLVSEANHISATPQSITSTLQAQHASFVALAAKTAALDGELQKLKHTYRTLWRARTGSARDPFNELDRGSLGGAEFGIEGLAVA